RDYGFSVQEITKSTQPVGRDSELVVVSYEMVIRPVVWKSAMRYDWDALTLDEVHLVKTPSAKRTRAVFGAKGDTPGARSSRADRVACLTGTPMTKDPSVLWVIVSRLFPSILEAEHIRNRRDWVDRWCEGYETPYGFRVTGARD